MTRTSYPWPIGLLGMIVLVCVIERGFNENPFRFSDTASLNWRLSAESIPREVGRCQVACMGDSLVKIGVIPRVVQKGTGLRTYNFAMAQASAPATYFLFRRILVAGGHPSAIVVDYKPSILAGSPAFGLRLWREILTPGEILELGRDAGRLRMTLEILLGRLLPSVRSRFEVREAILAGFRGETSSTFRTNQVAVRNWSKNLGAHFNASRGDFSGQIDRDTHGKLRSDDWRCHRINALYVNRLLTLAESSGVEVYWVIPPLSPALQTRRERSGVDEAYVAFVRSMQVRHPKMTVIDGRRSHYRTEEFDDPSHLNGRGAMAFSHELALILARRGLTHRWVNLPRYRDWPIDVMAEDIDQSRLAVEATRFHR